LAVNIWIVCHLIQLLPPSKPLTFSAFRSYLYFHVKHLLSVYPDILKTLYRKCAYSKTAEQGDKVFIDLLENM